MTLLPAESSPLDVRNARKEGRKSIKDRGHRYVSFQLHGPPLSLIPFRTVLLVFIVIFASAVTTLYLRARRRRATHRTTLVHQIPLSNQTLGSSNVPSSRAQAQQAARKKSHRERERMNLAFGVVDEDESRAVTPTPSPYGPSVSMPASSATMVNPYGALMRPTKDPFVDPVQRSAISDDPRLCNSEVGRAVNSGNAHPHHPMSPSHSSTSSPQRPLPAKQASTSSPSAGRKGRTDRILCSVNSNTSRRMIVRSVTVRCLARQADLPPALSDDRLRVALGHQANSFSVDI